MTAQGTAESDCGFALLIVLWAVALLTLIVAGLAAAGRTEAQLASNLRAAAAAEAAADGATYEAVFHLLDPTRAWAADGMRRTLRLSGAAATVWIDDEAGKVNPNTASPELLRALLLRLDVDTRTAEQVAAAIVDWRFPGDQPRNNGAKAPQYRAAGRDYGPPGAPFLSLDELGAVLGMTPALLDRLLPYVSILTDDAPDPARAASPVRQALIDVFGPAPATGRRPAPRTVTVTAQVAGDAGGRFTRRAAVRLGATATEPLFRVLTWEALEG